MVQWCRDGRAGSCYNNSLGRVRERQTVGVKRKQTPPRRAHSIISKYKRYLLETLSFLLWNNFSSKSLLSAWHFVVYNKSFLFKGVFLLFIFTLIKLQPWNNFVGHSPSRYLNTNIVYIPPWRFIDSTRTLVWFPEGCLKLVLTVNMILI